MHMNSFSTVHDCIIDDIGKLIFWYEKMGSAAEEIKIKLLRLIIVTELGIFSFLLAFVVEYSCKALFSSCKWHIIYLPVERG